MRWGASSIRRPHRAKRRKSRKKTSPRWSKLSAVHTPPIVLDSTVLVSAFLAPQGAAAAVLGQVRDGRVELALSEAILQETARVLLTYPHIRERYHYPDSAVHAFCEGLAQVNRLLTDFPP